MLEFETRKFAILDTNGDPITYNSYNIIKTYKTYYMAKRQIQDGSRQQVVKLGYTKLEEKDGQ